MLHGFPESQMMPDLFTFPCRICPACGGGFWAVPGWASLCAWPAAPVPNPGAGWFALSKASVGNGVLLRPACADALPQLLERGFGVCFLVWHGQETSDLASSKQRPIFILTLS